MTTATMPRLSGSVQAPVEAHAFSETAKEVGGILVGRLTDKGVDITASIPALRAAGAATHVTFTHEVWADVLDTVEDRYQGQQIVGWYHTHPGFGLFLSEYDLFIHRNFFSDPRMVALVVDPVAGELGWFGWQDGQVEKLATAPTMTEAIPHEATVVEQADRSRSHGGTIAIALVAAGLVGGIGGYLFASSASQSDGELMAYEQQLASQNEEIRRLEQELDAVTVIEATPGVPPSNDGAATAEAPAGTTVTVLYRVQPGDSWWQLADIFYGDGQRYQELMDANEDMSVDPGDEVLIPVVPVTS